MIKREIKFRAWHEDEKKMIYLDIYQTCHDKTDYVLRGNNEYTWIDDHCEDLTRPLMQYTGLKDMNGKEIYEFDIIKYAKWNCIVKYKNASFILECINFDNEGDFFYFADMSNNLLEIIGNIFETPELLKV